MCVQWGAKGCLFIDDKPVQEGNVGMLYHVMYHSPANTVLFEAKFALSEWPLITYYRITLNTDTIQLCEIMDFFCVLDVYRT